MIVSDPNETPEHMIERIKRRRTAQLILIVIGLTAAIVVGIGATALLYQDTPKAAAVETE